MSILPFSFSPMIVADIPAVMALERVSFPNPWSPLTYRNELTDNPHSYYWVLRPDPVRLPAGAPPLLAYGGYWLAGDEAHIVTLATHPDWRRRRLGCWLLLEMISVARRAGAQLITLEVRVSNQAAIALYGNVGFEQVGRRRKYYPNGEDALLLSLSGLADPHVWQRLDQMQSDLGHWELP